MAAGVHTALMELAARRTQQGALQPATLSCIGLRRLPTSKGEGPARQAFPQQSIQASQPASHDQPRHAPSLQVKERPPPPPCTYSI